jgi:hypothetical protein
MQLLSRWTSRIVNASRSPSHTESIEHPILHNKLSFQRGWHPDASNSNCLSTQMTETKKADVDDLFRVSVHIGLFCNEPPDVTGLLFIESSDPYSIKSDRERTGSPEYIVR